MGFIPGLIMSQNLLFSVCFPHQTVKRGVTLLNSPELWGSRAALGLEMPRFNINTVAGPVRHQDERVVSFRVHGKQITLIKNDDDTKITADIEGVARVSAHLFPTGASGIGYMLQIFISNCQMDIDKEKITATLQAFVPRVSGVVCKPHPALDAFRAS